MLERVKRSGVATAIELYQLAEAMLVQRLTREHPTWSRVQIEREVDRWRVARPGAEHGDALGRVVRWPRRRRR
jgi:hypothetical protein